MRSTIYVLFLSSLLWGQSQAPAPVPASQQLSGGTVTGTVKVGTKPVRSVTVALTPESGQPGLPGFQREVPIPQPPRGGMLQAVTDERGQFVFTNVPAGDYRVGPIPEVYILPDAGLASTGIPVKVSDGQSSAAVELSVVRGGVITGKITDSEGRPVIAERVNLSRVEPTGRPRGAAGGNRAGAESDDRGIYRIYGLAEGRYVLSAGSEEPGFGPMRRVRYPRTWHPNVSQEAQATIIEISSGKVAENVDIKLGEPAETFTVEGRTIDAATGRPVPGITVSVMQVRGQPGGPGGPGGGPAGNPGMSDAQGVFRISGLPSGNYVASVNNFGGGPRSLTSDYYSEPARFQISDGDASGLEVRLHQGVSITGFARIEGVTDGPTIAAMLSDTNINAMVRPEETASPNRGEQGPPSGRFGRSNIGPDGTFRIGGLAPGHVTLSVNAMRGPSARLGIVRIERNGAAVPNEFHTVSGEQVVNLAVVVREANASIRGKVIVTGGTSGVRVTTRRIDTSGQSGASSDMVDQNGNFEINGLMPGSYEVTARSMGGRPQLPGAQPGRPGPPVPPGGGGGGNRPAPVRLPEVKQMVTVTAGNVSTITLTLDLSQQ